MSNTSTTRGGAGVRRAALERGSVPVPNFFIDVLMRAVSKPAFAVLLFVWRKTVGWDKAEDWISLSQMQAATGLSRPTVLNALRLWKDAGLIRRSGRNGIRGTVAYAVAVDYSEAEVCERLARLGKRMNRLSELPSTGKAGCPPPVKQADTQEITIPEKPGKGEAARRLYDREKTRRNIERRWKLNHISSVESLAKRCTNAKEKARMEAWVREQKALLDAPEPASPPQGAS